MKDEKEKRIFNKEQAIQLVVETQPDLVLMDIHLTALRSTIEIILC